MLERPEKTPSAEALLEMTLQEWVPDHVRRHKLSAPTFRGISTTIKRAFSRAPFSSNPTVLQHLPLYQWLRDESINKLGRKSGSANNSPVEGIVTVRDLCALYQMAPTRIPSNQPWVWILGRASTAAKASIDKIEKMLQRDGLQTTLHEAYDHETTAN